MVLGYPLTDCFWYGFPMQKFKEPFGFYSILHSFIMKYFLLNSHGTASRFNNEPCVERFRICSHLLFSVLQLLLQILLAHKSSPWLLRLLISIAPWLDVKSMQITIRLCFQCRWSWVDRWLKPSRPFWMHSSLFELVTVILTLFSKRYGIRHSSGNLWSRWSQSELIICWTLWQRPPNSLLEHGKYRYSNVFCWIMFEFLSFEKLNLCTNDETI